METTKIENGSHVNKNIDDGIHVSYQEQVKKKLPVNCLSTGKSSKKDKYMCQILAKCSTSVIQMMALKGRRNY